MNLQIAFHRSVINFKQRINLKPQNCNCLAKFSAVSATLIRCVYHLFLLRLRTGLQWQSTNMPTCEVIIDTSLLCYQHLWECLYTLKKGNLCSLHPWLALLDRQLISISLLFHTVLWSLDVALLANDILIPC